MRYEALKEWINQLEGLNESEYESEYESKEELKRHINNLRSVLERPPVRQFTDPKIVLEQNLIFIMNSIEQNLSLISRVENINYGAPGKKLASAGMILENLRKERGRVDFMDSYPKELITEEPELSVKQEAKVVKNDNDAKAPEPEPELAPGYKRAKDRIVRQINEHIKKLEKTKSNPFLRSPEAKIAVLKLLKDRLENPKTKAPGAESISDLILDWKHFVSISDEQRKEVKVSQVLEQHRNKFFSENRNKETSTSDFISGLLLSKESDTKIYKDSESLKPSIN